MHHKVAKKLPQVCRMCLASLESNNTPLKNLDIEYFYEKLTNVKFQNGDPEAICCYCYATLIKCWKFIKRAQNANSILEKWHKDAEWMPPKPLHTLVISNTKCTEFCPDDGNPRNIKLEHQADDNYVSEETGRKLQETFIEFSGNQSLHLKAEIENDDSGNCKDSTEGLCETNQRIDKGTKILDEPTQNEGESKILNDTIPDNLSEVLEDKYQNEDDSNLHINDKTQASDEKNDDCNVAGESSNQNSHLNVKSRSGIRQILKNGTNTVNIHTSKSKINNINNNVGSKTTVKFNKMKRRRNAIDANNSKTNKLGKLSRNFRKGITMKSVKIEDYQVLKSDDNECKKCGIKYETKYQLKKHMKMEHGSDESLIRNCQKCDFKCKTTTQFKYHCRYRQPIKIKKHACDFCEETFPNNATLLTHIKIHFNKKELACPHCDYTTEFPNNLKKHALSHSENNPYVCKDCGEKHKTKYQLQKHRRIHNKTDEKPVKICPQCGFTCETSNQLLNHKRFKHPSTNNFGYVCDHCNTTHKSKNNLERHIFLHTGLKPYSCAKCGKKFKCKQNLITHNNLKHVYEPQTCKTCNTELQNVHELKKHHTNCFRKFLCHFCGSRWQNKLILARHMMIHTGEKPFQCEQCPYKCNLKSSLEKHVRLHTNERPYACDKCSYTTRTKSNLNRHLVSHSSDRPFSCLICDAKFKTNQLMKRHVKRTHGIQLARPRVVK